MLAPLTKKESVVLKYPKDFGWISPFVTEYSCPCLEHLPYFCWISPFSSLIIPWQEICERMFFSMINEGFKILEVPLFCPAQYGRLHLAYLTYSKIQKLPYPGAENHFSRTLWVFGRKVGYIHTRGRDGFCLVQFMLWDYQGKIWTFFNRFILWDCNGTCWCILSGEPSTQTDNFQKWGVPVDGNSVVFWLWI